MNLHTELNSKLENKLHEWSNNILLFVHECLKAQPTEQQIEGLLSFQHNQRTSIRSGHGTGKDTTAAWCILWMLMTKLDPKIICTAPTKSQLRHVLWAEINKWLRQSLLKDEFEWNSEQIFCKARKAEWWAVARTINVNASDEAQGETLAGFHTKNMAYIVDESSAVPDPVYKPIEGGMTESTNKVLLIGNMTKRSGYFYDTHFHNVDSKLWNTLVWNSEDSPLVDDSFVKFYVDKYGRDSNQFRIRVLGEPPFEDPGAMNVIPFHWAEQCMGNDIEVAEDEPKYLGVDIARGGDDFSVIMPRKGLQIYPYHRIQERNLVVLGGRIMQIAYDEDADGIAIDEVGIGAGVVDWLLKTAIAPKIRGVNVSWSAPDPQRYHRLRDQLWFGLREKCMKQLFSFPTGEQGQRLCDELSLPTYDPESGKIKVEGKKSMKKRAGSPDVAEALLMSEHYSLTAGGTWGKKTEVEESYSNDPYSWMAV